MRRIRLRWKLISATRTWILVYFYQNPMTRANLQGKVAKQGGSDGRGNVVDGATDRKWRENLAVGARATLPATAPRR